MGVTTGQAARIDPRIGSGLAGKVVAMILRLEHIDGVDFRGVQKCQGRPKVSLPRRWVPGKYFEIEVTDAERGRRQIGVKTKRTGATVRHLRAVLLRECIEVTVLQ